MGSPTIFAGRRTKLLTPDGLLLKSGATIDNDGQIDTVKNGRFEADISPWEAYQNTPGASPLNGTGGTPATTFVRSTVSPLSGVASGLYTKDAADRQGEGFSIAGASPVGWQGKVIQVQFDAIMSAGYNGTTETMDVFVYDVTNSALLTAIGSQRVATGSSQFSCNFINSASSTNLRVICHVSGTGTAAWTMKIDDVRNVKLDVTGATMKEFYNAGRVQIPSGAGTLVTATAAQVLENKTLEADTTLIVDGTDNTKELDFDLTLATTGKKMTLQSQHTDDRTIQIPDADTTLMGIDTQDTVTNKDIDGGVATDASRITLPAETTANLAALTRKEGTIAWDSTLAKVVADDGSGFNVVGGGGAGSESVLTVTSADYTILDNDGYTTILVSTGATDRTITLPTLAANVNRPIRIKKIDNGVGKVIIDGEGSETIDDVLTKELLVQYEELQTQGSTAQWVMLNQPVATSSSMGLSPPQTGRSTGNLGITSWSSGTATVALARTRAYQLIDGQWRVQFNIKISVTGSSAVNSGSFTITGITAKNDGNGEQGICMAHQANQQGFSAFISPNTGNCTWYSSGNLVNGALHIFGDIEVESKPSWA